MEVRHTAFLSLGSNLGDRLNFIQSAISHLSENAGKVIGVSSVYETEPLGFISDSLFLNACIKITTELNPQELFESIKSIETLLGRKANTNSGYSSRNIDIDIIFFNDLILSNDTLEIPHLKYHERLFVLLPLIDLDKEIVDPKTQRNILKVLAECVDVSQVRKTELILEN